MGMGRAFTRRAWLSGMAAVPLANASPGKPMRGIFIIMSTPFTESGGVDYEDLEREVDFLTRCGVHGMVWPQLASEYASLSLDERMRGMELLAKASRGKAPALVLGVQGANVQAALCALAYGRARRAGGQFKHGIETAAEDSDRHHRLRRDHRRRRADRPA